MWQCLLCVVIKDDLDIEAMVIMQSLLMSDLVALGP